MSDENTSAEYKRGYDDGVKSMLPEGPGYLAKLNDKGKVADLYDTYTAKGVAELIVYYARLTNGTYIADTTCDYLRDRIEKSLIRFEERGRTGEDKWPTT